MNCQDAQLYVSALYDGESVPGDAVEHIGNCATCREQLFAYAKMGAELRLLVHDNASGDGTVDALRREVPVAEVTGPAGSLDRLALAAADLRAAGRIGRLELVARGDGPVAVTARF